MTGENEVPE